MSLKDDMIFEILKRVDGFTLARASCASSLFWHTTKDEKLWERLCYQLWPSTRNLEAKTPILSLGGFQKFFASCFPMVIDEKGFSASSCCSRFKAKENTCPDFCEKELCNISPSDFVSFVDVHYKDKVVYSKVIWGMPKAGDLYGWFSNCPFNLNVISSFDRYENSESQISVSLTDGLPQITSVESERKFGMLWNEIWNNLKLSWILLNRKENQAVNLASWKPLGGRKHWPSDKDFVISFGSIIPAHRIVPFDVVQCILEIRCKMWFGDGVEEVPYATLRLTELSMQLEDIEGAHVNGRNSLLILKRAPRCQRTINYLRLLELYHQYLTVRNQLREKKIRGEGLIDTLSAIGGILAAVMICFLIF